MRKTIFLTPLVLLSLTSGASAQESREPKIELGIHATIIDFNEVFEVPGGFGGRFTYNINDYISFDSELNYFPERGPYRREVFGGVAIFGSSRFGETQGLFGVKAGKRIHKFGVFAKVRPGFVRFTENQIDKTFDDQSRTRFALDIGGVFEYYPTRRIVIRFDLGNTLIDYSDRTIQTTQGPLQFKSDLTNAQGGVGIGFRF
ncbi:MAG TPA: outer membrane beta-barrel protein [Blastocatellia bacterium]|nr:outer membrane beta-barrel protein [Blastocatellia bacterium]